MKIRDLLDVDERRFICIKCFAFIWTSSYSASDAISFLKPEFP